MKISLNAAIFLKFYALFSILELGLSLIDGDLALWRWLSKPLLMPCLMAFVYLSAVKPAIKQSILLALFFSFLGDVLLLLPDGKRFFIFGLLGFLFAQWNYLWLFFRQGAFKRMEGKDALSGGLVLIFVLGLLALLWSKLPNGLLVPVSVYALSLGSMAYGAILLGKKAPGAAKVWLPLGGALFMVSDAFLALNKFYLPFSGSGFVVMSTYVLAQLFLSMGLVKLR